MPQKSKTLKLPLKYPIVGAISMIFGLYISIALIIGSGFEQIFSILILFIFFFGLGLLFFLWGVVSKIKLNDDYMEHTSIFGKTKTVYYKDIKELSFGKISKELKIKTGTVSIKAHAHLTGFSDLIETIEKHTSLTCNTYGNRYW